MRQVNFLTCAFLAISSVVFFASPATSQTPASCQWSPDGTTHPPLDSNSLYPDLISPVTITLSSVATIIDSNPDNNTACDVNRILPAQVTVRQAIEGQTNLASLEFNVGNSDIANFSLADGAAEVLEVVTPATPYDLNELQPTETVLWDIDCTSSVDGSTSFQIGADDDFDHGDRNLFLNPEPGEELDCTFTNVNSNLVTVKDDGETSYIPGGTSNYTITISAQDTGFDAHGVNLQDVLPDGASLNGAITCTATGDASCTPIDATLPCNDLDDFNDPQVVGLQTCGHIPADGVSTLVFDVPVAWEDTATGEKTNHGFGYAATQIAPARDTDDNGEAIEIDIAVTMTGLNEFFDPGGLVAYQITVENIGDVDAVDATISNPLPEGTISGTWECLVAQSTPNTCPTGAITNTNANVLANLNTNLTTSGIAPLNHEFDLPVDGRVEFIVEFQTDPNWLNDITNFVTVAAGNNFFDGNPVNNAAPVTTPVRSREVELGDILVIKTTTATEINRLDHVDYTIRVTNESDQPKTDFNIVDIMPVGFHYVDGTAAASHSAYADPISINPTQSGRNLIWGVTPTSFSQLSGLEPGESISLDLVLKAGGVLEMGQYANTATIWNSDGVQVAEPAIASVELLGDFFDCGTVIGQVFWDHNRNGSQDAGEQGVPGANIYDVRGNKITVDSSGRYNVPCQTIGHHIASEGSNYMLKIDSSTLPVGSSLTTEESRVVRLTAGKMSQVNFGIAPRSVEVSLSACNYIGETRRLNSASRQRVPELVTLLNVMEQPALEVLFTGSVEAANLNRERLVAFAERVQSQSQHQRIDITTKLWRLQSLTNHGCDPLNPIQANPINPAQAIGESFFTPTIAPAQSESPFCPPLPSIFFDTARTDIRVDQVVQMNKIIQTIAQSSCQKVVVTGYADLVGSIEQNSVLAAARAETVGNILFNAGLPLAEIALNSSLEVNWQGFDSPQSNENLRRVDLMLVPQ